MTLILIIELWKKKRVKRHYKGDPIKFNHKWFSLTSIMNKKKM